MGEVFFICIQSETILSSLKYAHFPSLICGINFILLFYKISLGGSVMGDPTTFRPMNEIILRNVALLDIPICPLCLVIDKYIHMYICSQLLVDRGATVVMR